MGLALPIRRVFARSIALVATRAYVPESWSDARGIRSEAAFERWLDVWLERNVERTLFQLVDEQREEERSATPLSSSVDGAFFARVALRIGVASNQARLACVAINKLPLEVRRPFVSIKVDGNSLHHVVAAGHGPPREVRKQLRAARRALFDALRAADRSEWRSLSES